MDKIGRQADRHNGRAGKETLDRLLEMNKNPGDPGYRKYKNRTVGRSYNRKV